MSAAELSAAADVLRRAGEHILQSIPPNMVFNVAQSEVLALLADSSTWQSPASGAKRRLFHCEGPGFKVRCADPDSPESLIATHLLLVYSACATCLSLSELDGDLMEDASWVVFSLTSPDARKLYAGERDESFERLKACVPFELRELLAAVILHHYAWSPPVGWQHPVRTGEFPLAFSTFYEGTAAQRTFQHHLNGLRNCPFESEVPEYRNLHDRIESAFRNVPYPGDNALTDATYDDEATSEILWLRGADPQTFDPRYPFNLGFATDATRRFFLPAAMLMHLRVAPLFPKGMPFDTYRSVLDILAPRYRPPREDSVEWRRRYEMELHLNMERLSRMDALDRAQAEVVTDFLLLAHRSMRQEREEKEWRSDRRLGERIKLVELALEEYWRPSLSSRA